MQQARHAFTLSCLITIGSETGIDFELVLIDTFIYEDILGDSTSSSSLQIMQS